MKKTSNNGRAARRGRAQRGFTLVEMLVVIGIIGILATALLGAFGYVKKTAWKARAQSQVSHVATALTVYLQNERSWAPELLAKDEFDMEASWVLQKGGMLDVTVKTKNKKGDLVWDKDNKDNGGYSPDRFGILDPWGRAFLRSNPLATEAQAELHRLQYRLDKDFDGYVDSSEGAPGGGKIRASVIVWSRGPDGLDDAGSSNPKAHRYPYDDCLSWSHTER